MSLSTVKNWQTFEHQANSQSTAFKALAAVLGLVLVDQITKFSALAFAPTVHQAMSLSTANFALGWHIHAANAAATQTAVLAAIFVTVLWLLPMPRATQILWTAAAIGNHAENVLRPGAVDFLAFRFANTAFVANIADLYLLIGTIYLFVWLAHRIRVAKSWHESVHPRKA